MYLARHVGGWSTTLIGRFYNGRDHSTVCFGIQRIESLRESDPDLDPLLVELRDQLGEDCSEARDSDARADENPEECLNLKMDELAELVAARVCAYLEKRLRNLW
jgi:hypothetical protein